jgi:hypothetical protein
VSGVENAPGKPHCRVGRGHTYKMLNFVMVSFRLYSVLLTEGSVLYFHNKIWGVISLIIMVVEGLIIELRGTPKYLSVPLEERLVNNCVYF